MKIKYLHTMVRVKDLEDSIAFYKLLGLEETRRIDNDGGRFTLAFLGTGTATRGCPRTAAISGIWPIRSRISTTCASICRITA